MNDLPGKTGWIHLGDVSRDLKRWVSGYDPTVDFLAGPFEIVGRKLDRRRPHFPHVGEQIRLTANVPVIILDYSTSGEKRRLDPPNRSPKQPLAHGDHTGIRLATGTLLVVRAVRVSDAVSDFRSVRARVELMSAAVTSAQVQPASDATDVLIRRILNGEPGAVTDAGLSGNRAFIPSLRQMLNDPRLHGSKAEPSWAVRIALGRLGDPDQLQRFWCEATREDAAGAQPIMPFDLIGGWYGFQALDRLLSPEGQIHFQRAVRKAEHSDVIFPGPKLYALDGLRRLAPEAVPGEPSTSASVDSMAVAARAWISSNREQLLTRRPTDAGVNWSEKACKNGKPTKK